MMNITLNSKKILNTEQLEAVKEINNFIKHGDPDEWFVLKGKAGVGKTTIISEILSPYINKKRIILSALSHKAKNVIFDKVKEHFGDELRGVFASSVASMLGMTFDLETGKFVSQWSRNKAQIKMMDIIIVDEASMINEEGLALIMSQKKKNAKVIFIGDIGQLPPIRENGSVDYGKVSPTFISENIFTLKERVRQGEESLILPYSDYYWNNSVTNQTPELDPIPYELRKTNKDVFFETNLEKTIEDTKEYFLQLTDPKKQNLIKVIVYKNETRQMINWYIRNLIYKEPNEYEVGDILIFNDNYDDGEESLIENSTQVSIKHITDKKFNGQWDGYLLDVTDGFDMWSIDVLSKKSFGDYNKYISELFVKAKTFPFGRNRTQQLKKAWDAKRRFANVDFAYALTSHKSQGSTYKYVIVVEDDILSVGPITDVEKSQSMYTAITRASDNVWVVSELNK